MTRLVETAAAEHAQRDASFLFSSMLERMQEKMSLFAFRGFLEPLKPVSMNDEELVLCAPSAFHRDWARDHYSEDLSTVASSIAGASMSVTFVADTVDNDAQVTAAAKGGQAPKRGGAATAPATPAPLPTTPTTTARVVAFRPERGAAPPPARLHGLYTFDTFVTGPSNRIAFAACNAVAEQPGALYSPLFLFGNTGLGKTHLLHAIGHEARARNNALRVVYMSAEQWVNEWITEIREKRFDAFRRRYRDGCDLLLIDDIQFLAGKDSSQDEFFHTFNSLYESHKQIVVTSDRYPHEIDGLEERLKTRLQWGLVADIQPPDLETRLAILQKKAAALDVEVPRDVAEYLAAHVTANVRELEGALVRLHAFASITREPIDLSLAREQLRPVLQRQGGELTLARITDVVAAYYGMRPNDLRGPSRQRQVTRARQVAMYLARQHLRASLPEIGRAFSNRDHTTVLSSVRKIDELRQTDAGVQAVLGRLTQSLFGS